MVSLLVGSVTYHMPQNRVSDIIMHVTLNIVSSVAMSSLSLPFITITCAFTNRCCGVAH
jgi:hypothetical protein